MGSSSSQSTGESSSTSFIPDYPQAPLLMQIAQEALNMAPQALQWGLDIYNKNQGTIDGLLRDALSYASPQRIAADMGMAEAGVQQGAEAGRLAAERDLESFGIDPSAGRYANLEMSDRVMASAAAAGAGNQQRMADIAAGNAMRQQAISASLQNAATSFQAWQQMNNLLSTASQLKYPPLGTVSQSRQQSTSQSVTDSGGGGGPKEQQPKQPSEQQPGGGGGGGAPLGGGGGGGATVQNVPVVQPTQQQPPAQPQDLTQGPFAFNPGGAPGPFQQAYNPDAPLGFDPNNPTLPLTPEQQVADWSGLGVDQAGNLITAMPGAEAWNVDLPDTSQLFQDATYDPNQYAPIDMATSPDANLAPEMTDTSGQLPDVAEPTSGDFGMQDYMVADTGYTPPDYGPTGESGAYAYTPPDYGPTGDSGAYTPTDTGYSYTPTDTGYSYTPPADTSYTPPADTSYTPPPDTGGGYSYSYSGGGGGGYSGGYARGGPVRRPRPMVGFGMARRGPPRPPMRTGFRPAAPRPRPPAPRPNLQPAPTVTARAAGLPRQGYLAPSGMPQAAPGTMPMMAMPPPGAGPPQRPPGMAGGGRVRLNPSINAMAPAFAGGGGVDPTTGGFVSRSLSPSGGDKTDDVDARLNAGEFVIPKDVAHWKGKEFFYNLIKKARQMAAGGPVRPQTGYGQRPKQW